jgi:predicted ATPase
MLQLVETFGGEERSIDAAVLSDGTLRVLAVAAAVLSVEPGSLVVIEQIDNGVHPSRARQLMSTLQDVADKRNIRLLVTTHNPALLDAIPLGSVGDAVACFRDPISGESRLQRLRDLPDYVAVTARGPLGVLSTSGALDRFLKHRRTEAEQDEQAQRALRFFRDAGE